MTLFIGINLQFPIEGDRSLSSKFRFNCSTLDVVTVTFAQLL